MERLRKFFVILIIGLMLSISVQAQTKEKENPYFTTTNSFSPNADGKNDLWKLDWKTTPDSMHLTIFNRWGQLIADSKSFDFVWNGKNRKNKNAEEGTYVFSVEVYSFGELKKYTGSIVLLR